MRIHWEDLNYLVTYPVEDIVHRLLFATLLVWIERTRLRWWWLVPAVECVVSLRVWIIKEGSSFGLNI